MGNIVFILGYPYAICLPILPSVRSRAISYKQRKSFDEEKNLLRRIIPRISVAKLHCQSPIRFSENMIQKATKVTQWDPSPDPRKFNVKYTTNYMLVTCLLEKQAGGSASPSEDPTAGQKHMFKESMAGFSSGCCLSQNKSSNR
jgi:hypothetical protein